VIRRVDPTMRAVLRLASHGARHTPAVGRFDPALAEALELRAVATLQAVATHVVGRELPAVEPQQASESSENRRPPFPVDPMVPNATNPGKSPR
jgi:hypothetical protein